jgi:membrane protein YqaA with SNARE-associated domain
LTRSLSWFLTWWGTFLMAALDASLVFYLPFGVDTLVIFQSARNEHLFWIYPLLATAGSIAGAAITMWVGRKVGESGLERFMPRRRLDALRRRVKKGGAIAVAIPAFLPPPFPLTPFILTCGALSVSQWHFFTTFTMARLVRFGAEAVLARVYGAGVLRFLESEQFRLVITGFIIVATIGTAASGWLLWRSTHRDRPSARPLRR